MRDNYIKLSYHAQSAGETMSRERTFRRDEDGSSFFIKNANAISFCTISRFFLANVSITGIYMQR